MEQIGKLIGKRKYEALKALDLENIDENTLTAFNLQFKDITVAEGLKMVEVFETEYAHVTTETNQRVSEYFDKINAEPKPREIKEMTKDWLWERFAKCYKKNEGVSYARTEEAIENIKPLIYYFIGDFESFEACVNVSSISKPCMKKGLLIIGDFGNGKTSTMKALSDSLRGTNVPFRKYTTNQLVTWYEECNDAIGKEEFNKAMLSGTIYFDDVLTEREASNYGKSNLMKDIIEQRYDRKLRTYITCNLKDGSSDLNEGLMQFGDKYGSRVYDRLFGMFNVVEFKGKSFRGK